MSPKKILIVDDEPYVREVAKISLETTATDWKIITAESGFVALEMAKTENPDAILLDVMMPGMDGISTFKKLQESPKTQNIPVILLTAKVQQGELDRYARYGVNATIAKPFDPLTFAAKISALLNW
jgi:CheY-like chemotaxis protein